LSAPDQARVADCPAPDDDNRYHVTVSEGEGPEAHVLKQDDTFAVFDRFGDISAGGKQGVYSDGTRFVSSLRLLVQGRRPLILSSNVLADNVLLHVDLTNPDLHDGGGRLLIPSGALHMARSHLGA
jgi:hypothetical protein